MASISTISGNPAHGIRTQYSRLMGIACVNTLRSEALEIVNAGGISPKNAAKFRATVGRETSLPRLQSYLTNFVLAADGDAVIGGGPRGR